MSIEGVDIEASRGRCLRQKEKNSFTALFIRARELVVLNDDKSASYYVRLDRSFVSEASKDYTHIQLHQEV